MKHEYIWYRVISVIICLLMIPILICWGNTPSTYVKFTPLTNVKQESPGFYTCNYAGVNRSFYLFIPDELPKKSPLLFMLHGYAGNCERFAEDTLMDDVAANYGYGVVYPQGIPEPTDPTSGPCWNSGLKDAENDDVGFLVSLAHYLQENYNFSPQKTFAAGFSNGAFMVHRLAVEAPQTFRAVASVVGFMPELTWNKRSEATEVGVLQINGTLDEVVPFSSKAATNGNTPAIEEVIDYWGAANGLNTLTQDQLTASTSIRRYTSSDKKAQVWYVLIQDGRHSWPKQQYCGFNVNKLILEYFNTQY